MSVNPRDCNNNVQKLSIPIWAQSDEVFRGYHHSLQHNIYLCTGVV